MSPGTLHGIWTLLFMTVFIVMVVWVYLPRRRKHYDDAAALPFEGGEPRSDDAPGETSKRSEKNT
jgi:cbb3-type cytochrome oxidase subunit 3